MSTNIGSDSPLGPRDRVAYNIAVPGFELRRRLRPFQIERLLLHLYANLEVTERCRRDDVDAATVVAQVAEKRLVFAVTAGRTGTVFLTRLLELIPDCTSLHEPEPAFQRYLRRVQADPRIADEFLLKYKLPFIADVPTGIYVETSHVVSKGFLSPMLNLGLVPSLILLRRAPRKIAVSYLERYTVPGRTKYGLEFLVHPGDPGVMPLPGWRKMSDYQLCFWYALEMERRQAHYGALVREMGGAVVDVTSQELNDPQRFLQMISDLGLADIDRCADMLRNGHARISQIAHNKNPQGIQIGGDFDAEENEVWDAISRFEPRLRRNIGRRYGAAKLAECSGSNR